MPLNISIFRNIQMIFMKFILLFVHTGMVGSAEFCIKEVLISPDITKTPPMS